MFDGHGERGPDHDGRDFVAPQKFPETRNDQSNREPEVEEQEASNRPERKFEELPVEDQKRLLESGLAGMKLALGDVKDYAVFASTAMYLNGEDIVARGEEAGKELLTPPGDFDAAVFSEESLDKIRDRAAKIKEPTHRFLFAKVNETGEQVRNEDGELVYEEDFSGYVRVPGEEMKKLAGKFVFNAEVDGKETPVEYDFELFNKSRVVSPELANGRTRQIDGLNVLDLDGLQKQYEKNLEFEGRIEESVGNIVEYLHDDREHAEKFRAELANWDGEAPLSNETQKVLEHLDMGAEEMAEVMKLQQEIDEIASEEELAKKNIEKSEKLRASYESIGLSDKANEQKLMAEETAKTAREQWKKRQALVSKRAMLLAGTKTKVWKRQLNVLQLARLRGRE